MNKTRVIALCEKMAAKQIDITWSCQSRVNTYDEDMLRAMKNAGCHTMQLGLESGSDEILKKIKKGFSVSEIKNAVKLARKFEIEIDGFFILGFPGETKEQAEATINLAKQLDCGLVSFQLLMPLTGTGFEKESITRDDITYDDRDNVIALNENFTPDELQNIQKKAYRTFYFRFDFIVKKLFEIRTVKDFLQMARQALDLFTVHNKTTRYISQHEAFKKTIRRYQAKSSTAYLQILLKQFDYDYWLWNVLYLLPTQGKLYDLGCGIGFISMLYKAINGARVSVAGIDIHEKRIHTARVIANGHKNINFKIGDIVKCHVDGANAVLLADVLRYLPVEQQNTILRHVYEMLSTGATLIIKEISYKNDHLLKTGLHRVLEKVFHPTCSIYYREAKEMYNFLRKTGYSEVKIITKAPHYIVTCER
jgi:ubiquinone/menaquinone biosynthesis C-methylase UbiE